MRSAASSSASTSDASTFVNALRSRLARLRADAPTVRRRRRSLRCTRTTAASPSARTSRRMRSTTAAASSSAPKTRRIVSRTLSGRIGSSIGERWRSVWRASAAPRTMRTRGTPSQPRRRHRAIRRGTTSMRSRVRWRSASSTRSGSDAGHLPDAVLGLARTDEALDRARAEALPVGLLTARDLRDDVVPLAERVAVDEVDLEVEVAARRRRRRTCAIRSRSSRRVGVERELERAVDDVRAECTAERRALAEVRAVDRR